MSTKRETLRRLLFDEAGQDIIEYSLLTGMIGVGAAIVVPSIKLKLVAAFSNGSTGLYNHAQSNWFPKNPQ